MKKWPVIIIRQYKRFISPLLPPACRFIPTCSEYAIEAFEKKGFFRGSWLTVKRVAKCHPFHPGGYDPVDPAEMGGLHDGPCDGTAQSKPGRGART